MMSETVMIQGDVAAGFEPVRAEFGRNFSERGELGAACAVYYQGRKVVDLWGGVRDERTQAPWQRDTMVPVFSSTKGLASMALAHAHSRGLFSYDELVAHYWPAFAENGKGAVTVRQLLSHQAGLCAIDEPLDMAMLADPDRVAAAIGKQPPAWQPGTRHGYHAISLGWYEGELLRRVDPVRRTIGRYFHEEVASPLGIEFYIGLPEAVPADCVATLKTFKQWQMLFNLNKLPRAFALNMFRPNSLSARALGNPKVVGEPARYNERAMQALEIPAANGIGQARGMARAYSEFALGGRTLALTRQTLAALEQPATLPANGPFDEVLRMNTAYSLGYIKPSADLHFGSSRRAYGTAGMGGSFAFADPDAQLGFAYTPNKLGFYLPFDPRDMALRAAVFACLGMTQV